VLRVYAEAHSPEDVQGLLEAGNAMGQKLIG
jgi:hypothetical protein